MHSAKYCYYSNMAGPAFRLQLFPPMGSTKANCNLQNVFRKKYGGSRAQNQLTKKAGNLIRHVGHFFKSEQHSKHYAKCRKQPPVLQRQGERWLERPISELTVMLETFFGFTQDGFLQQFVFILRCYSHVQVEHIVLD